MHLMIDLETLGTDTDCVVTQLGYCVFDIKGLDIAFQNELHLRPQEQIDLGRKVSWKTLQWWNDQEEPARENMFGEGGQSLTLEQALAIFHQDVALQFGWDSIEGVWSNGLTFDVAIMTSLYKMQGVKIPWDFRAARDTRTLWMLTPNLNFGRPRIKHSAMQDAVAQACNVQKAYFILDNALALAAQHSGE